MIRMLYPCEYLDSIFSIDYRKLYQLGYRGILLDIVAGYHILTDFALEI